jgi:hypothetical protein
MLAVLDIPDRAFEKSKMQEGALAMKLILKFIEDGGFELPENVRDPVTVQIRELLGCL